jgi:hypothetical protein
MAKRQRSDSITAAIQAKQAAALPPLAPPAHCPLRDVERPFFDNIVRARARDTWTQADLELAVELAAARADAAQLRIEIADEGKVLINPRGTPIANPKHLILESTARRIVTLSRLLHVHAEATVGESRDSAKAATLQRAAAAEMEEDDGLIPRLRVV